MKTKIAAGLLILLLGCPWSAGAEVRNTQQHCIQEWPNDYSMREYCEKRQLDAYKRLNGRRLMVEGGIWRHCVADWAEDWTMMEYCVNKQEAARDRMRWAK